MDTHRTSRPIPTTKLPGFGLPLNYIPTNYDKSHRYPVLFPNALDKSDLKNGWADLPLTTLREFTMMRFMNAITDKPGWQVKVLDDTITQKWITETLTNRDIDMTENMLAYCIAELQHKAILYKSTRAVSVYTGDVVKSDTAVSTELQAELKSAVSVLENVPAGTKDWHPGSDGKVLDLVHPSLFPLVYGRSRILTDGTIGLEDCLRRAGEGVVVPVPPEDEAYTSQGYNKSYWGENTGYDKQYSRKFQWLPCDVEFVDAEIGEKKAKIVSYVNNLHPVSHRHLYTIIEQIIDAAIPLWSMTLTKYKVCRRISYFAVQYETNADDIPESEWPTQGVNESDDDFDERFDQWKETVKVLTMPDVDSQFEPPAPEERPTVGPERVVDVKKDYTKTGLQVIVKLANIILTPEKPNYEGGTWHVEGQLNEHICATAIYYYDSENITTSHLSFRQHSNRDQASDVYYEQNDNAWLSEIFGCSNFESTVQEVGDITTTPGRLVTFPNILQHRVKPFRLADPTKPGHRKILALFLVDPNIRIISTANVPPQQQHWWGEQVIALADNLMGRFPPQLQNAIVSSEMEFPVSLREAKELREELIEERRQYVTAHGREFELEKFSLCEH
ncbi:hypothetical protein BDZ91DRAFT_853286 [Kalaharituber pfeilii]|nr:hypothetical protein BDZ91DRAFT_853286 [Kalaharituber pfeilii]